MKIGIIGLGYVGLPLLLHMLNNPTVEKVVGVDLDENKINALKNKESYLSHIDLSKDAADWEKTYFSVDPQCLNQVDAIIVCVPTPLSSNQEPDLSYIEQTMKAIAPILKRGQTISLESTTYPGTTEEVVVPLLETSGLIAGSDFHVVYSPEREDPNNQQFSSQTIPKLVSGLTEKCLMQGIALYQLAFDEVVPMQTIKEAEMAKLLENIYRAVNIGLINELKIVAHQMGIDIWRVIEGAATKPFGFVPFYPGPGLGGHCIPVDPFYLSWKAKEYDVHTHFIELAGEVNRQMPKWTYYEILELFNTQSILLKGAKVIVVGLAYKKNIDDTRESPAIELFHLLHKAGANVSYVDPFVPHFPKKREYTYHQSSLVLTEDVLESSDCVIIATDHDLVDYELIANHASLVIDTRGVYRHQPKPHIYSL